MDVLWPPYPGTSDEQAENHPSEIKKVSGFSIVHSHLWGGYLTQGLAAVAQAAKDSFF